MIVDRLELGIFGLPLLVRLIGLDVLAPTMLSLFVASGILICRFPLCATCWRCRRRFRLGYFRLLTFLGRRP